MIWSNLSVTGQQSLGSIPTKARVGVHCGAWGVVQEQARDLLGVQGQDQLEVCMWQAHLFYYHSVQGQGHRQAPSEDLPCDPLGLGARG